MTPVELLALCVEADDRFKRGEVFAERPFLYLTIPRAKCPAGRSIRLYGTSGPLGEICNIKRRDGVFDVLAVFRARPIMRDLIEAGYRLAPLSTPDGRESDGNPGVECVKRQDDSTPK